MLPAWPRWLMEEPVHPSWLLNDVAPHHFDWVPALDLPLLAETDVFSASSYLAGHIPLHHTAKGLVLFVG